MSTNHPLRAIKSQVDVVLKKLSPLFDEFYVADVRSSIPTEHLLKARVLSANVAKLFFIGVLVFVATNSKKRDSTGCANLKMCNSSFSGNEPEATGSPRFRPSALVNTEYSLNQPFWLPSWRGKQVMPESWCRQFQTATRPPAIGFGRIRSGNEGPSGL